MSVANVTNGLRNKVGTHLDFNALDFTQLLFNEGEATCFGENKYATAVFDAHTLQMFNMQFFVINPLHATLDLERGISGGRRADANVIACRNILVEMDKIPLAEQQPLVDKLKMPYSTATFSGSKSIHYIISLETSLSASAFRSLAKRVYVAVGGEAVVDDGNFNPSRFSRFPGAMNIKTDNVQQLLEVKTRVKNSDLESWLLGLGVTQLPERTYQQKPRTTDTHWRGIPNRFTKYYSMFGGESPRHKKLLAAACDYARCNYTIDEALKLLTKASLDIGIDRHEINRTVENAFDIVDLENNKPNTKETK